MNLKTPIREAGLIYKLQAKKLEKLGIKTIGDLLLHFPARYENYTVISKIDLLQEGEVATIRGEVLEIKNIYTKYSKKIQKAIISDGSKSIECIWFNQPFVVKNIKKGDRVSIVGRVSNSRGDKTLIVFDYEVLKDGDLAIHTQGLVPIYPETRGLSSKWIRNRIYNLILDLNNEIIDYLPSSVLKNNNLIDYKTAIEQIHFPKSLEIIENARNRLAFDELFLTQLSALNKRKEWESKKTAHILNYSSFKKQINELIKSIPFELTNAQKNALDDIFTDLSSSKPMNRLLEGDVGSGKTVVAAIAMYLAFLNGFQSVLMTPTEILAQQHYQTISNLLSPLGIKVNLFTSNSKKNNNDFDIAIGTHALLNDKVKFEKLGLVVIDEQQRFGVKQRAILRDKGLNPHFLTMTATPIPRTIFLTLYGDLDLSYLDEMPKGRTKVKTWLVPQSKRASGYEWIKKQIRSKDAKGNINQVFIICPFIEESESMITVKAAKKEFEFLKENVFKEFKLGLLHGKMKPTEKTKILEEFRDQKLDILVATPVVEVGIDIQNATIIIIEEAQRFGLAQLHQLRGRVGRGEKESYCLLFTDSKSPKTIERLKCLEKTHLGAELAELDLKLRGPGELYGTMQHGNNQLKVASFSDFELINKTRKAAEKIAPEIGFHPEVMKKLKLLKTEEISPD